jgi:hypothetical protein
VQLLLAKPGYRAESSARIVDVPPARLIDIAA